MQACFASGSAPASHMFNERLQYTCDTRRPAPDRKDTYCGPELYGSSCTHTCKLQLDNGQYYTESSSHELAPEDLTGLEVKVIGGSCTL